MDVSVDVGACDVDESFGFCKSKDCSIIRIITETRHQRTTANNRQITLARNNNNQRRTTHLRQRNQRQARQHEARRFAQPFRGFTDNRQRGEEQQVIEFLSAQYQVRRE